ncbi:MAG: tetratricopeptide repeat protein [Alphaproteobacteria bacterium]
MPSKIIFALLGTTLLCSFARAGVPEAVSAYETQQYDRALEEFTYLSDEGDATASYYMGEMYLNGYGVEADKNKAIEYFQKADNAGNTDATAALAKLVYHDDTIENNHEIGLEYLKKVAYAGNADALYELGEIYANGDGVDKEYTYAFGYYLMAAMKGDKRAQHKLAFAYLNGRGTTQDFENGIKWLSRSANQGYVLAQKDLADLQSSDPRLNNLPDAYAWYSIIAAYNTDDIGSVAAARREEIAAQLGKKKNVLIERQRAARDWRPIKPEQSVSKEDLLLIPTPIIPGFNDAQTLQKRLTAGSVLHTDGSKYGIFPAMVDKAEQTQDISEIAKIAEDTAKNGYTGVYAYFGDLMQSRFKDDKGALQWYLKGADAADSYARYQAANLYCEGRGMDAPNVAECYKWLLLAQKTQDAALQSTVAEAIAAVEAQGTPEELAAGKAAADRYETQPQKKAKQNSSGGGFNFF